MITQDVNGWYFPLGDCRIGPYSTEAECRGDYERYLKWGRISEDKSGTVGATCADCEGI